MSFIWLAFFVLSTAQVVFSNGDIDVRCGRDSLVVTWKITEGLRDAPFNVLLGDCFPSKVLPSADGGGGGEVVFHYRFSECLFRQKITPEELVYENELHFIPLMKSNTKVHIYPIKCVSKRPFLVPAPTSYLLEGEGRLSFHMILLNDDLSGPASSNSFPLGSFVNVWASVEQQAHQSLMLYLEECVMSDTPVLEPQSWAQSYPIIANKGCLVDGKTAASRFLPRSHPSSLVLQLQAFRFAAKKEVYIHCKLAVWDPDDLNEENKACNYNRSAGRWELLDDPFQNDLCGCCDYGCGQEMMPYSHREPQEQAQSTVLGPLILTPATSK